MSADAGVNNQPKPGLEGIGRAIAWALLGSDDEECVNQYARDLATLSAAAVRLFARRQCGCGAAVWEGDGFAIAVRPERGRLRFGVSWGDVPARAPRPLSHCSLKPRSHRAGRHVARPALSSLSTPDRAPSSTRGSRFSR